MNQLIFVSAMALAVSVMTKLPEPLTTFFKIAVVSLVAIAA
jgi:hypothetical protein